MTVKSKDKEGETKCKGYETWSKQKKRTKETGELRNY